MTPIPLLCDRKVRIGGIPGKANGTIGAAGADWAFLRYLRGPAVPQSKRRRLFGKIIEGVNIEHSSPGEVVTREILGGHGPLTTSGVTTSVGFFLGGGESLSRTETKSENHTKQSRCRKRKLVLGFRGEKWR